MTQDAAPGETTQFLKCMEGGLLGWDHPESRLREALEYDHFHLVGQVTGVKVIGECVEDPRIEAALKAAGVGLVQGFGVHQPEPLDDLLKQG